MRVLGCAQGADAAASNTSRRLAGSVCMCVSYRAASSTHLVHSPDSATPVHWKQPGSVLYRFPLQVYRAVAGLVGEEESDLPFAAAMVQAFNLILLTSPEVGRQAGGCCCSSPGGSDGAAAQDIYITIVAVLEACAAQPCPVLSRGPVQSDPSYVEQLLFVCMPAPPQLGSMRELISRAPTDPEGAALFADLFASWCYSCGAALALCLLGQVGRHDHPCAAQL